MNIINKAKNSFSHGIEKMARTNIKKKLQNYGIDYQDLSIGDFNVLVVVESEILESDTKKIGVGIGLAISLLIGFIYFFNVYKFSLKI